MLQDHVMRDNGIYGINSNVNTNLDDLSSTISDFDLHNITRKGLPLKIYIFSGFPF